MKYLINIPVTAVSGTQMYSVEAKSKEDALAKLKEDFGQFKFECEEIEITNLEVESIEDSSAFWGADEY